MTAPDSTTIIDNLVTAVLLLDETLTICEVNPASEQLFSLSQRKLVGSKLNELGQHCSLDSEHLIQALEHGQSFSDSEVIWGLCDGKALTLDLDASPIIANGTRYVLLELRAVDQQRRISHEVSQYAQQQAAKELVRGLAHEIKNPLGGLRGAAQLLEKVLPSDQYQEYTQMIIEQADRLRNLVDRLLGPQKPGLRHSQNIHAVLERVRQLLQYEAGESVVIERDYDPSLPDFEMDSEQLEQALLNIVRNALQALASQSQNPAPKIVLKTRTEHQVNIKGQHHRTVARIDLIDNGPGIPDQLQDTLFYPMVSGRSDGTGLGLSIARNLVDQHQGKIEVVSWPGHTAFTVYLPIK